MQCGQLGARKSGRYTLIIGGQNDYLCSCLASGSHGTCHLPLVSDLQLCSMCAPLHQTSEQLYLEKSSSSSHP